MNDDLVRVVVVLGGRLRNCCLQFRASAGDIASGRSVSAEKHGTWHLFL